MRKLLANLILKVYIKFVTLFSIVSMIIGSMAELYFYLTIKNTFLKLTAVLLGIGLLGVLVYIAYRTLNKSYFSEVLLVAFIFLAFHAVLIAGYYIYDEWDQGYPLLLRCITMVTGFLIVSWLYIYHDDLKSGTALKSVPYASVMLAVGLMFVLFLSLWIFS